MCYNYVVLFSFSVGESMCYNYVFFCFLSVLVRVCVSERGLGPCEDMKREPTLTNFTIQCVSGPDR